MRLPKDSACMGVQHAVMFERATTGHGTCLVEQLMLGNLSEPVLSSNASKETLQRLALTPNFMRTDNHQHGSCQS